jgi:hypothetical protein
MGCCANPSTTAGASMPTASRIVLYRRNLHLKAKFESCPSSDSGAEIKRALNMAFDAVNLHRPTVGAMSMMCAYCFRICPTLTGPFIKWTSFCFHFTVLRSELRAVSQVLHRSSGRSVSLFLLKRVS